MKLLNLIIILSFFLQFFSTFPFVIISLILLTITYKNYYVFPIAFLGGLFLDTVFFKPIGFSSFILLIFAFLILSYQSKFEIETNFFVFLASFLAAFSYLLISGFNYVLAQSLLCAISSVVLFTFIKRKSMNLGNVNYG